MGQKILEVKLRPNGRKRVYNIAADAVEKIMAEEPARAGELLFSAFKGTQAREDKVSDVVWLEQLVSWTPQGEKAGMSIKEMAPYIRLAERIGRLPDDKELRVRFSDYDIGLLHTRMTRDDFKWQLLSPALAGFVADFLDATGKKFDTIEDDEDLVAEDEFIVEE